MRILVTVPSLEKPGGVANYFGTLRKYLPDDVEYFTVGSQEDSDGIWKIIRRSMKGYRDFFRLLRKEKYDLVHINPSLGSKAIVRDGIFLLIAKALKIKVVVFMHGWDVGIERMINKYYMPLFRFTYMKADAFIVLGTEFKEKLVNIGFAGQVFLETTVVDDDIFSSMACDRRQVESKGHESSINILMLTRIEKTKGVYEGIDAYQILRSKYPLLTLTIAGSGSELNALEEYASHRGITNVDFPGFVEGGRKRETFERASIYLSPTYSEGMPIAMLEAMAYGLPVVSRPVGGIRDFFENGKMGYVTESLDPSEFAKLLEMLVVNADMRLQIGAYNYDYSQKNFMASRVAGRLQETYLKVLSGVLY